MGQPASSMRKKDYRIEDIRAVSFVMVIVIHVTNYFCRAYGTIPQGQYLFALVLDTVARFSVPCFFMITGALLLGREESLHKAGRRLLRFLIVLAFWSIVYYLYNTYYTEKPRSILKVLYVPTEPHLWYLYAMIPIYAALPYLQIMCRGMNEKLDKAFLVLTSLAMALMYVMSFFDAELYYDLPLVGDRAYAYYVFLGYFLYQWKDRFRKYRWLLAALFAGGNGICILATALLSEKAGDHYERLLEYQSPFIILASASFFLLMLNRRGQEREGEKEEKKSRKLLDLLCSCSFGIYLIHIIFLDIFKKYVDPREVSAYGAVPLLSGAILGISLVSVLVIRKLPGGKKIT